VIPTLDARTEGNEEKETDEWAKECIKCNSCLRRVAQGREKSIQRRQLGNDAAK